MTEPIHLTQTMTVTLGKDGVEIDHNNNNRNVRGLNQYAAISILNSLEDTISFDRAEIWWGKFTQNHDENQEISGDDIKKLTIAPGSTLLVTARGRQSAASGCEGILDLKTQGKVIGRLYFSSPWGLTYDNDFQVQNKMKGFYFEHSDINRGSGPLGSVTVDVFARKFLQ